jgi:predicted ester cyclase
MSVEENRALGRRWGDEIWGKGNLAVIDELYAGNLAKGEKEAVGMFLAAFTSIHATTEDIIAEGDKVVVRWTWAGTHKGEFMGIAPTGKQVTLTGINILRIEGGKIVEEWSEMDNLGMMQQLGVKVG